MRASEILDYVDRCPGVTREVFSSITGSKSSATKAAAKGTTLDACKAINTSAIADPISFIKTTDVDTIVALASDWSFKQSRSIQYRLTIQPFKKMLIRVLCYIYDLNAAVVIRLAAESAQGYFDIGDGIFLAGLYIALSSACDYPSQQDE